MTRDEAIDFIEQVGADLGFIDVELVVNKIYNEHEAQLKAKDDEIKDLQTAMIKLNEHYHTAKDELKVELKAKDKEIEMLKESVQQWHKRSIRRTHDN